MAPRKHRRCNKVRVVAACSLPSDQAPSLLEIVARANFFTLVRCATLCKHLRCEILSPPFIRRVIQQVAPCILALLSTYNEEPLTLVHPVTPTAASFWHDQLSQFMLRNAGNDVLSPYYPVASRGGLVVLDLKDQGKSKGCFDLCVYDPMTGHRMFLLEPPDTQCSINSHHEFVLLTEADDIGSSFMLLSIIFNRSCISVQTTTSSSGSWGPITCVNHRGYTGWSISGYNNPAILRGGVIHWLTHAGDQIVTYDVRTRTPGCMKLPLANRSARHLHLVTSPDGNLLKLLDIERFIISVWLQLPTGRMGGGGDGWALETEINIEEQLHLLYPGILARGCPDVEFEGSRQRNGHLVLLKVQDRQGFTVLDLETQEMHTQEQSFSLLEFNLPSRLQTMKLFP